MLYNHIANASVKIYTPSFEDCLTFLVHSTLSVHKDGIAMMVDHVQCSSDKLQLTDNVYTSITNYLKDSQDLSPEGKNNNRDSDLDESDSENVCEDTTPLFTSSGRRSRRPDRLDL
ncbi:Hypothetical predicted protein [Paramuricea clavata]|uniref:Uncharacterized protein n=1 Tax=Paramuricea clavata TaxID=317549 RepID=A0A7D9D6J4_PARCT|nr:Hypothetical predicted protein [Paramuricea clavata]